MTSEPKATVRLQGVDVEIANYSLINYNHSYLHLVTKAKEVIKLVFPLEILKSLMQQLERFKYVDLNRYVSKGDITYKSMLAVI